MFDRKTIKDALTAAGVTLTDQQADTARNYASAQIEFMRQIENIYRDLISLDIATARTMPSPEPKRAAIQQVIAFIKVRVPELPDYAPRTTAELLATT